MVDERDRKTVGFCYDAVRLKRRDVLLGGLAMIALTGDAGAQDDPAAARPKPGDLLVRDGDGSRTPLAPADVPEDAKPIVGWAMERATGVVRDKSRLNRLVIGRLGDQVFAFTAICTHDGCDVTDWLADEHMLSCPCHYSKFDPKDGGRVKDGPAPRALPQLPLAVTDGKLVVAAVFTSKVGFESQ
jgi:rieske iron-sulfur protein